MSDIEQNIDDFFSMYFKKTYKYIEDNENIKKDYTVSPYPELDFIFLFKFVRIELLHLQGISSSVINKELRTIFKYASLTVQTLINFKKSQLSAHVVYKNDFSIFNEEIKNINQKLQTAISKKDISMSVSAKIKEELDVIDKNNEKYKVLNKKFADLVQEIAVSRDIITQSVEEQKAFEKKVFNLFLSKYKKSITYIYNTLIEELGFFTFLINQQLWKNTFKNKTIMNFFERMDLENVNIITYMKYHLKSQTSEDDKGKDQISFRHKLQTTIKKLDNFYKFPIEN